MLILLESIQGSATGARSARRGRAVPALRSDMYFRRAVARRSGWRGGPADFGGQFGRRRVPACVLFQRFSLVTFAG